MKPEEKARQKIDQILQDTGWELQDHKDLNRGAFLGVAVREFPVSTGFADYLLFVDRRAAGVIEAKPEGTTLTSAEYQSEKYLCSLPSDLPCFQDPLPFAYESTGIETFFRSLRDPDTKSRRIFAFHTPETLLNWASDEDYLRKRLQQLPPLITAGLRDCQTEAIQNLERSFSALRPRDLIQMATGSGKTFMAVSAVYRLIKFANARRVLFLVDRNTLGQADPHRVPAVRDPR